ncbi:MAG: TonB-dependent receptor [Verrucomicrobiota bacterium]|nr:TonB-dependent receptor [Verrucomicrobiota bacterium]
MKIASIILSLIISNILVNAQVSDELDNTDIYGDLSKYLSWPMSATAFSGDDLRMLNRFDDRQLADLIPNFSKTDTGIGSFGDVISIRGLTNTPFFSSPSVVQYVDDVPSGNVYSHTASFYGTEKVEILRGAQSTLFGVNSYGGVINIESKRPSDRLESSITSSIADYDTFSVDGSLMGPLNDENTISYRLGISHYERDGVLNNPFLNISPDFQDHLSYGGSLYWNPNDNLEISLSASFDDFNDGAHRLTPLGQDPFTLNSDIVGSSIQESESMSLRIKNSGESFDFLSVTYGRNWKLNPYHFDLDFSPNPGSESKIFQTQESRGQEFRFSSIEGGTWDWAAGASYADIDVTGNTTRSFFIPLPPEFGGGFAPVTTTTDYSLNEESYGLFGQVSYNGIENVGVHLGLRGDQYDKSINRSAFGLSGPVPNIDESSEYSFISPRAGIDFELSDSSLLYLNSGIAYKPGGYSAFIDDPKLAEFDKEQSWTKEIGLKKRWLDDLVRTNIAIFHNNIDDYQVERSLVATDYAILNAEEARSYGAEIELSAEIFTGVTLEGSFGRTTTELTNYTDPISGTNLSGNKAPFVPELDASLAATYTHDTGLFARVELVHQGEIYFNDQNDTSFMENGFTVINATIGYRSESGYELSVFGGNLTDETYYVNITPDLNAGTVGLPQMIGIRARWEY